MEGWSRGRACGYESVGSRYERRFVRLVVDRAVVVVAGVCDVYTVYAPTTKKTTNGFDGPSLLLF